MVYECLKCETKKRYTEEEIKQISEEKPQCVSILKLPDGTLKEIVHFCPNCGFELFAPCGKHEDHMESVLFTESTDRCIAETYMTQKRFFQRYGVFFPTSGFAIFLCILIFPSFLLTALLHEVFFPDVYPNTILLMFFFAVGIFTLLMFQWIKFVENRWVKEYPNEAAFIGKNLSYGMVLTVKRSGKKYISVNTI